MSCEQYTYTTLDPIYEDLYIDYIVQKRTNSTIYRCVVDNDDPFIKKYFDSDISKLRAIFEEGKLPSFLQFKDKTDRQNKYKCIIEGFSKIFIFIKLSLKDFYHNKNIEMNRNIFVFDKELNELHEQLQKKDNKIDKLERKYQKYKSYKRLHCKEENEEKEEKHNKKRSKK